MIYTVISRTDILTEYFDKLDCKEGIFSEDVLEYISDTKNHKVRCERISAYTSLLYSLEKIFGLKPKRIMRTDKGKPFIEEGVSFSLSHTNGLCAVTLSDSQEVGVDIQELISEKTGERVTGRFLSKLNFSEADIKITFLYLRYNSSDELTLIPLFSDGSTSSVDGVSVSVDTEFFGNDEIHHVTHTAFAEDGNSLSILNTFSNDSKPCSDSTTSTEGESSFVASLFYTKKWTSAEAASKLCGGGLCEILNNGEISEKVSCSLISLNFSDKYYLLANAVFAV